MDIRLGELHLVTVAAVDYKHLKAQWKSGKQQVSPSHSPGIHKVNSIYLLSLQSISIR